MSPDPMRRAEACVAASVCAADKTSSALANRAPDFKSASS
jgi:hypothetical protein